MKTALRPSRYGYGLCASEIGVRYDTVWSKMIFYGNKYS
jgi:hypothetical protein